MFWLYHKPLSKHDTLDLVTTPDLEGGGHLAPGETAIPCPENLLRQGSMTPAQKLPQPEGPHSPLFRESGPGPVPTKEQNDSISILQAPL